MRFRVHPRSIALVGSVVSLLALSACGGGSAPKPAPPPPALTVTTTSLADGVVDQSYSVTLQSSGGTGARTWSLAPGSGPLPNDLTLSSTGIISGTPTVEGTFDFTVQVSDSGSPQQVATRGLSIFVRTDALTIVTTTLPAGAVGVAYSAFVFTANGSPPFSWNITAGALPAGVIIDGKTGEIGGLPTTEGTSNFTVEVIDDLGDTATADLTIVINAAPSLAIHTTALPDGALTRDYSVTLLATGGTPPLTWSVTGANPLPSGLSLDPTTGEISGTPAAPGTQSFTVQVDDSAAATDTQSFSLTILNQPAGRNETTTTATPLSNVSARASISPYIDPVGATSPNPDVDVYEITAAAGDIVVVRICARSLSDPRCTLTTRSPLDSVIEIVDSSGVRFATGCRNEGTTDGLNFDIPPGSSVDSTPGAFDDQCVNDDVDPGIVQDSKLEFQVPAGTTTFFVRVLDFRGDARPDMLYDIIISGAN